MPVDWRAWIEGPEAPELRAGKVSVWAAELLPSALQRDELAPLLAPDERARAERFRFADDATRYTIGRGWLRLLLGRHLAADPARLALRVSSHGKPELAGEHADSALRFNVSHSGELVLFAFGLGCRLGVDVELVKAIPEMEGLVRANFSTSEQLAWSALPATARERAFYDAWTRKEAFVKAVGEGLSHPLAAFDVELRPGEPAALLRLAGRPDAPREWSIVDVSLAPDYAAAVVAEQPDVAVETFQLESVLPRLDEVVD